MSTPLLEAGGIGGSAGACAAGAPGCEAACREGAAPSRRQKQWWAAPAAALSLLLMLLGVLGPLESAEQKSLEELAPLKAVQLSAAGTKVQVKVYGMSGCPFTRAFIEGPLSEALATVPELMDLHFYPFGNSFYTTEACGGTAAGMPFASYFQGYNASARKCWDQRCGRAAEEPAPGCYSGDLVCQHGVTDCMVTTAWACAKSMAGGQASGYMPFVQCTAQRFLGATSQATFRQLVERCARASGLVGAKVIECASGEHGRMLFNAQGRETVPHAGVPYVLVEGQELEDTNCAACGDGIMQKVCEVARQKTGADTPVCKGIFGEI